VYQELHPFCHRYLYGIEYGSGKRPEPFPASSASKSLLPVPVLSIPAEVQTATESTCLRCQRVKESGVFPRNFRMLPPSLNDSKKTSIMAPIVYPMSGKHHQSANQCLKSKINPFKYINFVYEIIMSSKTINRKFHPL